jgi:hypothetical protein
MKKALILSLIMMFALTGCTLFTGKTTQENISLEQARVLAADFINGYLIQDGSQITIKSVTEENNLYKVVIAMNNGQEFNTWLTLDGKLFFPNDAMNIEQVKQEAQQKQSQGEANQAVQLADLPKTEKPMVELFVMSFCPYGVQAEAAMEPVVGLLGDQADINIRFIASISDSDLNSVKSLHGVVEGIEDARQLCIAKNYSQEVFWQYVKEINEKCYPIYRQGEDIYKECWEAAANTAGVSISKVNACLDQEGVSLIQTESSVANSYNVSGSPTLIINGARVNPARTPEGYKQAICSSFNTPPAECSEILSSDGAEASGGC